MGEKGYSENFYIGADYGLDPDYGKEFSAGVGNYKFVPGTFGYPSDPTSANQLANVSKKLNTGAKVVEVSGINIMGGGAGKLLETIPKQHFKEINRLKKLVGVDLTFHGPLIEASGWSRQGYSESEREGAERQLWSAVERAHDLEPKGNIIVTLHTSNLGQELTSKMKMGGKEEYDEVVVYDEQARDVKVITPREDALLGKTGEKAKLRKFGDVQKEIDKLNKEGWTTQLSQLAFHVRQGQEAIENPLGRAATKELPLDEKQLLDLYSKSKTPEGTKYLNDLDEPSKKMAQAAIDNMNYGDVYLKQSYQELQTHFNRAWDAVQKSGNETDKKKLIEYSAEFQDKWKKKEIDPNNPKTLGAFGEEIQKGVNLLNSLSETPKFYRPMNDFIIEKSAETYSNIAFNAYKKFKDSAPIISLENPPAGGAISRGEDLKKLVEESRKKFVETAKEKLGISEKEAEKQAEKLIGVTWDVGHINMIRKFGYEDKDILAETKKVAPFVKHVHLSDNFGYEHTELPMGMGNVPLKGHLDAIQKYNKAVKQIVETGDWFSRQGGFGFTTTPVKETLRAFGSPIYSMKMGPSWGSVANTYGGGFSGMGAYLPDRYFSSYGTSFSNLPVELGGQTGGRSRVSGAPIE